MAARLALQLARSPVQGTRLVRGLKAYREAQESLRRSGRRYADLGSEQLRRAASEVRMPLDELRRIVRDWFEIAPAGLVGNAMRPGLTRLLELASAQGVRLGVLSDYPPLPKLAALGIADRFDIALGAGDAQIGCFKPEPRGLLAIVHRWGLTPGDCVFVGDRVDVDAEAARRAGMRCVIIGERHDRRAACEQVRDMAELADSLRLNGTGRG